MQAHELLPVFNKTSAKHYKTAIPTADWTDPTFTMTTASCYRPSSTSSKPPSSSRWQSFPDICPESLLFVHTRSKLVKIDINHCAQKNVKSCLITIPLQDQLMRFIKIESVVVDNKQARMLWLSIRKNTFKVVCVSFALIRPFLMPNCPMTTSISPKPGILQTYDRLIKDDPVNS